MRRCWAASIGKCVGPISGEHQVTESLYGVKSVSVVGLLWCRTERVQIGVSNLKAKILCRGHNSALSPVDIGGKHAFETLGRFRELGAQRASLSTRDWSIDRLQLNGPMFERWLVKTAVNLIASRDFVIADGAVPRLEPVPETLVRVAFGLEELAAPTGTYLAWAPSQVVGSQDTMTIGVLADPGMGLLGILFTLQGFRFLLWFANPAPPRTLEMPGIIEEGWETSQLRRHHRYLGFKIDGRVSHYIDFMWSDQPEEPMPGG